MADRVTLGKHECSCVHALEINQAKRYCARFHNRQFRGDAELARQEEQAQIEEAETLAISRGND